MEAYLRLSLLILGGTIIFFVLLEVWLTRRRQSKADALTQSYDPKLMINSEPVISLDPREHTLDATGFRAIEEHEDFIMEGVGPVRVRGFDSDDVAVLEEPVAITVTEKNYASDILVLSIIAQPDHEFSSYDLLHAIYATGLAFGEMNIFHYYDPTPGAAKAALFSLASATEPGEFDLDKIGDYSCSGLTLFTVLGNVPNPQQAFELMLNAAEQLADDLNGELRAGPLKPWTQVVHQQYLQKVLHFQLKNHA
jgi:FtsZ-interacting cell division protein ZipA